MDKLRIPLLIYLAVINVVAFVVYAFDKVQAKRKGGRVPERTLLWLARIGGGAGCGLGMLVFRHKTKHIRFKVLVPLWTVIWIALVLMLQNGYFKFLL